MNNFEFCSPTEIVFGRGVESTVGERLAKRFPAGRVMLVYGGGSIKRSGLYDRVVASLRAAGLKVAEKGGVRPNPDIGFIRELIAETRKFGADFLLAVGGGSVIDTVKATAMGVPYDGDVWDFFEGSVKCVSALPLGCVLTIPAAGSETSMRVVVSNGDKKWGTACQLVRSLVSFINPELFFTLPAWQVAAGVVDIMSHIMERYFTNTTGTAFTDGQAEAAMRTVMASGLAVRRDVTDYDAWCQVALVGTFAHNGFYGLGYEEDWACHGIEHELSAWDPKITHGAGLAVVIPGYLRFAARSNPRRVVQWARNVMGVEEGGDGAAVAKGVSRLVSFYTEMGMPTTLAGLGASAAPLDDVARRAARAGTLGKYVRLTASDIKEILESVS